MNMKTTTMTHYYNGKNSDGFSTFLGVAQELESLPFVRCLVSSQICLAAAGTKCQIGSRYAG